MYQSFLDLALFQENSLLSDNYGNDLNIQENGHITSTQVRGGNLNLTSNTLSAVNCNGSVLLSPDGTGVVQVTKNIDANSNKIINLADPVSSGDAVNKSFLQANYLTTGSSANTGNITFSSNTVSTSNTNGNIILSPNGTGVTQLSKSLDANSNSISNVTTLTATTLVGSLSTPTQPNVTSLGTQSSALNMGTNNITNAGTISATTISGGNISTTSNTISFSRSGKWQTRSGGQIGIFGIGYFPRSNRFMRRYVIRAPLLARSARLSSRSMMFRVQYWPLPHGEGSPGS